MAFCTAVTLSFASLFALSSIILLSIAFSTDNWQIISVDREVIEASGQVDSDLFYKSPLYYTRTRGIFRECFPGEKRSTSPQEGIVSLYLSPAETWCFNLDYYIPDSEGVTKTFDNASISRLHMIRAMVSLFILSFIFYFLVFLTGIIGCWRASSSTLLSSGILMLVGSLIAAGGMALWHSVDHFEKYKITDESQVELFVKSWPDILTENTDFNFDWSYLLAWISIGLGLLSSIMFILSSMCIRSDEEKEETMNMQYIMPVYAQKQAAYANQGYPSYPASHSPYYGSHINYGQY